MTRTVRFLRFAVLGIAQHPRRSRRRRSGRGPARNSRYRAWIRTLPCAACETTKDVEAAHTGNDGGMRIKASDYSCIPLCAECHRMGNHAYHVIGRADFETRWYLNLEKLVGQLNAAWNALLERAA